MNGPGGSVGTQKKKTGRTRKGEKERNGMFRVNCAIRKFSWESIDDLGWLYFCLSPSNF